MMWLLEGEKILAINLTNFTQHRSVSDRQSGMQQESYVIILTKFTVVAGKAWRTRTRVRQIRKIFITCPSV